LIVYARSKLYIERKSFAEVSKNLAKYSSENNFVGLSKELLKTLLAKMFSFQNFIVFEHSTKLF